MTHVTLHIIIQTAVQTPVRVRYELYENTNIPFT